MAMAMEVVRTNISEFDKNVTDRPVRFGSLLVAKRVKVRYNCIIIHNKDNNVN